MAMTIHGCNQPWPWPWPLQPLPLAMSITNHGHNHRSHSHGHNHCGHGNNYCRRLHWWHVVVVAFVLVLLLNWPRARIPWWLTSPKWHRSHGSITKSQTKHTTIHQITKAFFMLPSLLSPRTIVWSLKFIAGGLLLEYFHAQGFVVISISPTTVLPPNCKGIIVGWMLHFHSASSKHACWLPVPRPVFSCLY